MACVESEIDSVLIGTWRMKGSGAPPRFISIVPDFGRVEAGALRDFDFKTFRQRTLVAPRQSGIAEIHGALDVSLNHWENERQDSYFRFQWWGVIARATKRLLDLLREAANRSGEVRRPVVQSKRKWPRAALAYGIKSKVNIPRQSRGLYDVSRSKRLKTPLAWLLTSEGPAVASGNTRVFVTS
jgi:hypothetical protein